MAVYNQALLTPDPLYLQPKSYDARSDRKWFADIMGAGILNAADFAITVPGSPSGLTLNWAAGIAYVLGGNIADQGMYRQFVSTGSTVVAPAAHATLPRIDTVILRVMDNAADASGFNEARIEVVPGTATAGATLVNLTGKDPLTSLGEASKSFLVLAYILVPGAATVFTNTATNVKDARVRSSVGSGLSNSSGFPIGGTLEWNSSATLPDGGVWLDEDGSAIDRFTYSVCFAKMGIGAGAGNGTTTFNIGDSRGRVPVAWVPSGGHADVTTMFSTESVAVAFRRTRHRHTPHFHSPGNGQYVVTSGAGGIYTTGGSGASETGTLTKDGGSGNANDPLDGPAFIVKRKLLRVA